MIKNAHYDLYWNSFSIYTYKYDENGNMTESHCETEDGQDHSCLYEYDSNGNCIKETYTWHSAASTDVFMYNYDAYGNLLTKTRSGDSPEDYYQVTYSGYKLYYNPYPVQKFPYQLDGKG